MQTREELIQAVMAEHGGGASLNNKSKKKKWIAGSIHHPGAAKRAAQREGLSTKEWAEKHKHDSGKTGARAREALTLIGMHK